MIQNMVATSMMNSVLGNENDASHKTASEGISEDELKKIKYWSNILRISMLVISILMIITAYLNFSSTSKSSLSLIYFSLTHTRIE